MTSPRAEDEARCADDLRRMATHAHLFPTILCRSKDLFLHVQHMLLDCSYVPFLRHARFAGAISSFKTARKSAPNTLFLKKCRKRRAKFRRRVDSQCRPPDISIPSFLIASVRCARELTMRGQSDTSTRLNAADKRRPERVARRVGR